MGGRARRTRPLILVFEDVHWAEEPLLELIEHLAERVKDAPLMILCLARPELLDIRPSWGAGSPASATELEPLAPAESGSCSTRCSPITRSARGAKTLLEKTEGQPALRRGDDADAARGRHLVEADPGHAAGDDRGPHRPAARNEKRCSSAPR